MHIILGLLLKIFIFVKKYNTKQIMGCVKRAPVMFFLFILTIGSVTD